MVLGAGALRNVVAHVVIDTFLNPLDAGVVRNCQTVLSQVGSLAVAANAGVFKGFLIQWLATLQEIGHPASRRAFLFTYSIAKVFVDRTKVLLLANKGAAGQFVQAPVS